MALGIDSAAHAGAVAAGGPTVAVLPGSADRPYPPGKYALGRRIKESGTHEELVVRRGLYWKLYNLQFQDVNS